jgi:DNA-binding MarR family transcriptional regulator
MKNTMDRSSNQAGRVKSNQTLFQIINKLWELEEAGVTELAGHIGITKGAVHKHLKSMEDENFVVNKNGSYRLSVKFLTIGGPSSR